MANAEQTHVVQTKPRIFVKMFFFEIQIETR